jgi:hypothetical protein
MTGVLTPNPARATVHERPPQTPRDPSQLAKLIVDIAAGETEDRPLTPEEQGKDPAAALRYQYIPRIIFTIFWAWGHRLKQSQFKRIGTYVQPRRSQTGSFR